MKIDDLTPEDQSALDEERQLGNRICWHYLNSEWDGSIGTLDHVFDLWKKDLNEAKPSANEIALGLGSLSGDFLCQHFQCKWIVITDSFGCNLGILNIPTEWQVFPRHWVAKRVNEEPGTQLISGIIGALQSKVLQ